MSRGARPPHAVIARRATRRRDDLVAHGCHSKRSRILAIGAAAIVMAVFTGASLAEEYPSRPIRLILPFPPGGGSDVVARVTGQTLGTLLGQPVVIDNRAGASGNIAAELVAKANADGYTLLFGNSSLSLAPAIFPQLAYDPTRDLVAISMVSSYPFVTAVHPSVPAQNLREFIALAKSKPGTIPYASAGV
ncbi:MAG: hypothetical protein JWO70_4361, partial [Betaproteobacteria bacterium]|nr:hypothetical protein [Betaproteobacteria bacterium]